MEFKKDEHGLLGLALPCGRISFGADHGLKGGKESWTFVSNQTRAARVIARAASDGRLLNNNGCVSEFMNQMEGYGLPENISLIREAIITAPCASREELADAGIMLEEYPHWGIASPFPHLYLRHPQVTGVELWHLEQAVEILHQNAAGYGYGLSFAQTILIVRWLITMRTPGDYDEFERRVRQMPDEEFNAWAHEVAQRVARVKNLFALRRPSRLK